MLAALRPILVFLCLGIAFCIKAQCPSSLNNSNGFGTLTLFFEDSSTPDNLLTIDVTFPTINGNYQVTRLDEVYQTLSNEFDGETLTGNVTLNFMNGSSEDCAYDDGLLFDPLPVELSDFKGSLNGQDVYLSWASLSEVENAGFEIERSFDGEHYDIIGMRPGAGNSELKLEYTFEDKGVRNRALGNTVYYRLGQIDYDGKKTYSEILPVDLELEFEKFEITKITGWDSETSLIKVFYYAPENVRKVNFQLADLSGRVIKRLSAYPEKGLNFIELDLAGYHSKLYFLSLDNGKKLVGKKIALGKNFR